MEVMVAVVILSISLIVIVGALGRLSDVLETSSTRLAVYLQAVSKMADLELAIAEGGTDLQEPHRGTIRLAHEMLRWEMQQAPDPEPASPRLHRVSLRMLWGRGHRASEHRFDTLYLTPQEAGS